MSCRVITIGGQHYISYAGFPYVWCGAAQPSVCTTGDIVTDYVISFLDEAHPHYVFSSGYVGSLWGPDLYYYYNEMSTLNPAFPGCAHILFDVDTTRVAKSGLSIDPFFVYPTGVNDSALTGCYTPWPEMNVVRIERPSGVSSGTISQTEFGNRVLTSIEDIWGTGFYNRMAAVNGTHKLWIIRENSDSLPETSIDDGISFIKNTLIASGIDVEEYNGYCRSNERYLGWVVDCIKYDGQGVSCTGMGQIPVITQHECYCSGSEPNTNKLTTISVHGYGSGIDQYQEQEGDPPWTVVYIAPPYDNFTNCDNVVWPPNNLIGVYTIWQTDGVFAYIEKEVSYYLEYEDGIPKIKVSSICGQNINNVYVNITYEGKSEVPLDNYGLPNGRPIFEDFALLVDGGGTCVPELPDIVFYSHPPTQQLVCLPIIPNGPQDCTSINPE